MATAYGIEIEGSEGHQKSVQEVLKKIASNPVGTVILIAMASTKKRATILPFDKVKAATTSECNAGALPNDPHDAAPDGVRGEQRGASWYKGNQQNPHKQMPYMEGRGTGLGSDTKVWFSPDILEKAPCAGRGPGSASDEALLHELVHALRHMQGLLNPHPTEDGMIGYLNEEEFLAIVATNVYISASRAHPSERTTQTTTRCIRR